ncbi:TIGR03943 family putative permease subunit [Sporolactobacillus kofuensis]|uniref:TIGR03943 family putative permease subunit n=1 Tax=Sporolactobacillus kofuensis TaxID=269672 RepID=A0ABW1WDB0_9BACL|nr:TIGR03943 family protein [Sporolactobacillus kofuensis]MCO7175327.1 TIGR03943 family protein [Sporolactobacillus kofuensis]
MIRFIILFGFAYLFLHLHLTGDISKYINMRYGYLSFSMIFVIGAMAIYQIVKWNKEGSKQHASVEKEIFGHDHSHENNSWWKKTVTYLLVVFPLITGLFLPIATLDSNIVRAKGFHFAEIDNDKDQYANHQILKPDTSQYYESSTYKKMLESDMEKYSKPDRLYLDDDNYLRALEAVYNYPGNFDNKKLSIMGFVYHGDSLEHNQLFLFRFGIIHCIADAGVFGMMVQFPQNVTYKDDTWIRAEGQLSETYYQPFKQTIPVLKVTKWHQMEKPKSPYVYRKY